MYEFAIQQTIDGYAEPFRSYVYYFRPPGLRLSRLMIVHQGHWGDLGTNLTDVTALRFLNSGYDVLFCGMPIVHRNTGPEPQGTWTPATPKCGHQNMDAYASDQVNPYELFFNHISTGIRHATDVNGEPFRELSMCGISGGGFTTTVYAALDSRIRYSFAVAGTMPHPLESDKHSFLWENDPTRPIYGVCPMHVMYLLAAIGPEGPRCHRQLYNMDDFLGASDGRAGTYAPIVEAAAQQLGGDFDVIIDHYSRQHHITDLMQTEMLRLLAREL